MLVRAIEYRTALVTDDEAIARVDALQQTSTILIFEFAYQAILPTVQVLASLVAWSPRWGFGSARNSVPVGR
jgi:hypothetical protein